MSAATTPTAMPIAISPASAATAAKPASQTRNRNGSLLHVKSDLKDRRAYDLTRKRAHQDAHRQRLLHKPTWAHKTREVVDVRKAPAAPATVNLAEAVADTVDGDWDDEPTFVPLGSVVDDMEEKGFTELYLGDLMRAEGCRVVDIRRKRGSPKEHDPFEIIPKVATVIVLDDAAFGGPKLLDDWELLNSEDDDDSSVSSSPPTYAQVLGSNK